MKTVSISGSPRAGVGTKDAKALRSQGLVPCVVYGGKEQIHFSAPESQFKNLVYTPDVHTVKLDVGGRQFNAIMQDIQFHRISEKILHVDFIEVVPGKSITMDIPVRVIGNSPGVRAGGKLHKKLRTVKAKGPIDKLPETIDINIEKMEIGDSVRVGDLKYDGVSFLNPASVTIVAVKITRAVVEDTPAAAAAATPAAAPAAAAAKPADAKAAGGDAKKPEAKK